jgi:hypothetical protein
MATYGGAVRATDKSLIEAPDGVIMDRVQRYIFRAIADTMDAHPDELVGEITILRRESDIFDESELDGEELIPFVEWAWKMRTTP